MTTATPTIHEAMEAAYNGDLQPLIRNYFIILDEHEQHIPLQYNRIQTHFEANATNRSIIVKPRKVGFTTRWIAEQYARCISKAGHYAHGFTYDEEEAKFLFGMASRIHEYLGKYKPQLGTDRENAFDFPRLDSGLVVQTTGGKRKGRGRTPAAILLDEFAHYDDNAAIAIWASVVNSAPLWAPITVQSTPNGIGNKFHSEFVRAERGESTFKAHFYPWMWLPEKHSLVSHAYELSELEWLQGNLEFTEDELGLMDTWNREHPDVRLGEDNIRWRRYKQAEDPETFPQEYPEDSITCFMATTDSVFDTERLSEWVRRTEKPLFVEYNGDLKIYRRPQAGLAYAVGVDCGEGIKGRDNSCAVIGTMYGEVVAVLAGIYDQSEMAQMVWDIAQKYNEAFVLNERNGGFSFQRELNNMGYQNLYRHEIRERRRGPRPRTEVLPQLGFPTTAQSKPILITGMRNALKGDSFQCKDSETLRELVEYKRHPGGEYGAPAGSHDDRAMAAMLFLQAIQASERAPSRNRREPGERKHTRFPQGALG